MFFKDAFLFILFPYLNEWHTHSWKLESSELSINSLSKYFLIHFLSPSLQLVFLTDSDHLFLDVYVINSLTGWYHCLQSFPRLTYTFYMKTLFFPTAFPCLQGNQSKIFSLVIRLFRTWSIVSHQSFFPVSFLPYLLWHTSTPNTITHYYSKHMFLLVLHVSTCYPFSLPSVLPSSF